MEASLFEAAGLAFSVQKEFNLERHLLGDGPAAGIATSWAMLKFLGQNGFMQIVKGCEEARHHFVKRLREIPDMEPAADSTTNLLAIMSRTRDLGQIKKKLYEKGWVFFGSMGKPRTYQNNITFIFSAGNAEKYDPFLDDLEVVTKDL
jgi:tyrosine decarboxylase/aspartate 1-decarboxylase